MRKLIASTFVSLDGVMQAPGGPEEDLTGVFAFGGWSFSHWDAVMDRSMRGFDGKDRELVLGRRTYEIFEAYWPYQPADHPIAQTLNAARRCGQRRPSQARRKSTAARNGRARRADAGCFRHDRPIARTIRPLAERSRCCEAA